MEENEACRGVRKVEEISKIWIERKRERFWMQQWDETICTRSSETSPITESSKSKHPRVSRWNQPEWSKMSQRLQIGIKVFFGAKELKTHQMNLKTMCKIKSKEKETFTNKGIRLHFTINVQTSFFYTKQGENAQHKNQKQHWTRRATAKSLSQHLCTVPCTLRKQQFPLGKVIIDGLSN